MLFEGASYKAGSRGSFAVTQDDQRFLMLRPVAGNARIILVQNWFDELRGKMAK